MGIAVRLALSVFTGWMILAPALAAENAPPGRILLINSYHRGFAWSDGEESGFVERVHEAFPELDIPVEYLDAKRRPDEGNLRRMRDFLEEKYRGIRFHLIVALDNPAMDLLTGFPDELFPSVPVVFAGISHYQQYVYRGRTGITGVLEKQNVKDTLELALRFHPDAKKILVLTDYTTSGTSARREVELLAPQFEGRVTFRFLPPTTFDEARTEIAALPKDAIVLIQSYATDRAGKTLPNPESTRLFASAASVPVYIVHESRLGYGAVGGYLLAGREHGERAADLAVRVLKGASIASVPVDETGTSRPMFDYKQLQRFHIPLGQLPPGSVVRNRPVSVFETHGKFAFGLLLVVTALAVLAASLVFAVLRARRAKEETVRKSEELDRIFRLSLDLLCIASMDGRFVRLNPAWEHVLGYQLEQLEGKTFMDLLHPDDRPATLEAVSRLRSGKEVIDFTNRYQCRDGSYRWIEWRSAPYEQAMIYAAARDVTDRKTAEREQERLREQLFQSQKMETIGLLAGGVAHDFNNLLVPILGYSEMILLNLPKDDPNRPKIEQIHRSADMAKVLIARLLVFSRKQMLELKVVNVGDIVKGMVQVVKRTIREDIRIEIDIPDTLGMVRADKPQIEQALLNLAINAQDAMPGGGDLMIEARDVDLDASFAASRPEAAPGPYVMLSVSDTGVGMDEPTQRHIFEPFFTTKEPGKGTGLGLSTVYGIVKQHGGSVSVYSEKGRGTTFKIYLPRVTEEGRKVESKEISQERVDRVERGDETILLMEDNEAVRLIARGMLEDLGYRVLSADSVGRCLEIARKHPGPIHLLLTDVIMPEKNGREVYELLRRDRPEVRVLYMSGYTGNVIGHHGVLFDGVNFLQKPFSFAALAQKVRKALEPLGA